MFTARRPNSEKVLWETEFSDMAAKLARTTTEWLAGDLRYENVGNKLLEIYFDGELYDTWGVTERMTKVVSGGA